MVKDKNEQGAISEESLLSIAKKQAASPYGSHTENYTPSPRTLYNHIEPWLNELPPHMRFEFLQFLKFYKTLYNDRSRIARALGRLEHRFKKLVRVKAKQIKS